LKESPPHPPRATPLFFMKRGGLRKLSEEDTKNSGTTDPDSELRLYLEALKDTRANVRRCAAEVLGRIKSAEVVGPLIEALEDEDCWVRKGAVEALGNLRNEKAIPYLEKLKDDTTTICYDHKTVGDAAQGALEAIRR